jgi:hypothetical protein
MEISHVKINMEIEMFSCVLLFLISIDKTWYIKFEVFQKNYCMSKGLSSHYNQFFNNPFVTPIQFFNNPFVTPIDTSFLKFRHNFLCLKCIIIYHQFGCFNTIFLKR